MTLKTNNYEHFNKITTNGWEIWAGGHLKGD